MTVVDPPLDLEEQFKLAAQVTPKFSAQRRVWVLGSGFSKPLGGPLLPDLLSPVMRDEIGYRFGKQAQNFNNDENCKSAYWVYRALDEIWGDAEEYLEALDRAAADPKGVRANRIAPMLASQNQSVTLQGLNAGARRIVAAECAAFLVGEDVGAERWGPYREWALQLAENDTIVSFNYDLVLEKLREWLIANPDAAYRVPQLRVVRSEQDLVKPGGTRILKLHGSIDWKLSSDGKKFEQAAADQVLTCSGDEIAMGMPGPGKQLATTGPFALLWSEAEKALRQTHQVWFIGYRFPETDALARARLLRAISESRATVYTVLGPNNRDTQRLHDLLRWAMSGREPVAYQLYAQDLLDVWRPKMKPP